MGLASSALYRYFPSRDALITALITDAYDALGEAAEQAAGPGTAAPQTTIGPATRVTRLLAEVLRDALAAGELTAPRQPVPGLPLVTEATRGLADVVLAPPYEDLVERSLVLWVVLMGALSFELFGHLEQVVTDHAAWFDAGMAVAAEGVGLHVPITTD